MWLFLLVLLGRMIYICFEHICLFVMGVGLQDPSKKLMTHKCLPETKTNTNFPTIINTNTNTNTDVSQRAKQIQIFLQSHFLEKIRFMIYFIEFSYKWTVGKEEHAVGRLLWFSETMTLFNKIEIKWWNITTKRCNVTKACVGNRVRFVKWLYLCVVLVMEPLNCDSCLVWKMKKVWSAW